MFYYGLLHKLISKVKLWWEQFPCATRQTQYRWSEAVVQSQTFEKFPAHRLAYLSSAIEVDQNSQTCRKQIPSYGRGCRASEVSRTHPLAVLSLSIPTILGSTCAADGTSRLRCYQYSGIPHSPGMYLVLHRLRTRTLRRRSVVPLTATFSCCSLFIARRDPLFGNCQEDEAKIIAERVALRKRAEEMAAMARGDTPKVIYVTPSRSWNSQEDLPRLIHDFL